MHLVSCASPQEPLEDAPKTALLTDPAEGESWAGFWSPNSDGYYVRCTRIGGEVEWFQVADEITGPEAQIAARVFPLRPKAYSQLRQTVVVARSPDGRRMLVGSARRIPR